MKSLLLTVLLLGLVAVLKAQEDLPDDKEDLSGTWYMKGMVHNGTLPKNKLPERVFPVTITALEEGNLEVKIIKWKKGQCHEFKFKMEKTEEPNKYITFHGKRHVYIEKLNTKDHYIFYCEGHYKGKHFGMGKVMGRTSEESPEAMEEFKEFVKRKKIPQENIFVPEMREECEPESD
ncbi:odorant-binding protein 2a-like [Meriones unguiculatus]|uniref:odorant-binding protein 2a-like n=1 Tax=Meriones unguiculatus TaxID=10047 RepID=UPI000B4F2F39|nr:odorant-binding protein 2a-like [Meriones unguiculatus]